MSDGYRRLVLVRHGATEWSKSGRHTGVTDLPLLPEGEEAARAVGRLLAGQSFVGVLSSPRLRALETCRLAGLAGRVEVVDDLAEWEYGDFEGRTTDEIRNEAPGWSLWDDGAPGGETPLDVSERVDRVFGLLRGREPGSVVLFSHGHLLRALAARWVGLDVSWGRALSLSPGAVSVLGSNRDGPAFELWNRPPA